jgi:hypothetical protein
LNDLIDEATALMSEGVTFGSRESLKKSATGEINLPINKFTILPYLKVIDWCQKAGGEWRIQIKMLQKRR